MVRAKLPIEKLERNSARNATYTKRSAGIMKKAKELSILCGIEILLLFFSPKGKPILWVAEQTDPMQMIKKFYELPRQRRENSKLEILKTLKKTFEKLDHVAKIEDFMGSSVQTEEVFVQELTNQLKTLKARLVESELRLSCLIDPEKAQSIDHIQQMEDSLRISLNHIQILKARFGKQLKPVGYGGQFQNSTPLPMTMTNDQQSLHLDQVILSEYDHLTKRNLDSSASIIFHSYIDTQRPECSCRRGPGISLNDLNPNTCLQLGDHNRYQCYNVNFHGEYKHNSQGARENHVDYPSKFNHQPNTGTQTPASSFGSHGTVNIDEFLYAQTLDPLSGGFASSSNMAPYRH